MTENEWRLFVSEDKWLAATDPRPMLTFLNRREYRRRIRLFAVACCRRVWDCIRDPRSQRAVEVSESFADRLVSERERELAHTAATHARSEQREQPRNDALEAGARISWLVIFPDRRFKEVAIVTHTGSAYEYAGKGPARDEIVRLAALLRDIFGNPFRPVSADPGWLTSTVVALARSIYEDRAFDRLPILADALQDAGCEHPDVLDHYRGSGPHARGCWVVDLLLGKQ